MTMLESKKQANARYLAKQARINLTLAPFEKDRIQSAADKAGQSMTAYIMEAVNNRITQDEDGAEIPADFLSGIITALKSHGLSDETIVDILHQSAKE